VSGVLPGYTLALLASTLATPVDDQLLSLKDSFNLVSIVTGDDSSTVQGVNYELGQGILSEDAWHAFNVTRLTMMLAGWVFTCLDLMYMFTKSWKTLMAEDLDHHPTSVSTIGLQGMQALP